jgi:FixJ family two-component response regulator
MMRTPAPVSVVDDESVRESLPDLLRLLGFAAAGFPSAEEFLTSDLLHETSCLLLDAAMPGMSGPELQQELASRHHHLPIVFVTAMGTATPVPGCSPLARSSASPNPSVKPPC